MRRSLGVLGSTFKWTAFVMAGLFVVGVVFGEDPDETTAASVVSVATDGHTLVESSPRPEPRPTVTVATSTVTDRDCREEAERAMAKGTSIVKGQLRDQLGRGNVRFERPWVVGALAAPSTGECAGSFGIVVSGSVSGRVAVSWKASWLHGDPLGRQGFHGLEALDL
ncbi:MAG: hypothetical protein AAF865_01460 [Pseudomonadota bacterium]